MLSARLVDEEHPSSHLGSSLLCLSLLFSAADVMQTAHIILGCPEVSSSGCLDAIDELAVLIAAMIHDFKVCHLRALSLFLVLSVSLSLPCRSLVYAVPCHPANRYLHHVCASAPRRHGSVSRQCQRSHHQHVYVNCAMTVHKMQMSTYANLAQCFLTRADGSECPLEAFHVAEAFFLMTGDKDVTSTMSTADAFRYVSCLQQRRCARLVDPRDTLPLWR